MWKEKLWRRKLKNALQNNIIYYQILGHRIFCFLLNTNKEMKKKKLLLPAAAILKLYVNLLSP